LLARPGEGVRALAARGGNVVVIEFKG